MPLIQYITYKNISIFEVTKKILTTNLNILIITSVYTILIALFLSRFRKVQVIVRLAPRWGDTPSGISLWAGTAVAQTLAPEGLSVCFAVSLLREPGRRRSFGFPLHPPPHPGHLAPIRVKKTLPPLRGGRVPAKPVLAGCRTVPPGPSVSQGCFQPGPIG